jgi:hypothetical protein
MRERHNWAGKAHPSACTCAECTARRNAPHPVKKKNKPKSLRGKPKKDPLQQALDILKEFENQARWSSAQGEPGDKQAPEG